MYNLLPFVYRSELQQGMRLDKRLISRLKHDPLKRFKIQDEKKAKRLQITGITI